MGEGRLPVSGLWEGWTRQVTLARQGTCGERTGSLEAPVRQAAWAVLFFDDDAVFGHARLEGGSLRLAGWWGPAKRLCPSVSDLAETELWSSGDLGFHLRVGDGRPADVCFAWSDLEGIVGYRRREGG